jgi:uncharacterized protein YqjF (DUF2071 family)
MESIDRIWPTRRPEGAPRGYQRWRDLLFLHWIVPEPALRAVVPPALEIDTHDGNAYVGVVPFAMLGVRPAWLPERLGFDFLETNVRTYVHVGGRDPGVYFFSLEAASWLAVQAARLGWGLPYHHARMRLEKADGRISYESRRLSGTGPGLAARYRIGRELGASAPGTLEHFLFERYLLHVVRGSALRTGQVHHAPYPVWTAEVEECSDELMAAGGLPAPGDPPALCHYSPGVDVEVFALRRQVGVRGP